MLIYFDETTKKVTFDQWSVENVAAFRDLIRQFGRDAFEVVGLLVDYRSFYRHLSGKAKEEAILSEWRTRKSSLTLTPEKMRSPYFKRAIEEYRERNYDPLWHLYMVMEEEYKKDLEAYRTGVEEDSERSLSDKLYGGEDDDDELDDEYDDDSDEGYGSSTKKRKNKGVKPVTVEEIIKVRTMQRKHLFDTQRELEELRKQLFSKTAARGDTRKKLGDYTSK